MRLPYCATCKHSFEKQLKRTGWSFWQKKWRQHSFALSELIRFSTSLFVSTLLALVSVLVIGGWASRLPGSEAYFLLAMACGSVLNYFVTVGFPYWAGRQLLLDRKAYNVWMSALSATVTQLLLFVGLVFLAEGTIHTFFADLIWLGMAVLFFLFNLSVISLINVMMNYKNTLKDEFLETFPFPPQPPSTQNIIST